MNQNDTTIILSNVRYVMIGYVGLCVYLCSYACDVQKKVSDTLELECVGAGN